MPSQSVSETSSENSRVKSSRIQRLHRQWKRTGEPPDHEDTEGSDSKANVHSVELRFNPKLLQLRPKRRVETTQIRAMYSVADVDDGLDLRLRLEERKG
jgi:hypothetical protein